MPLPFPDHPLRYAVTQELHVRTFEPVRAPAVISHFAYLCSSRRTGANVAHLLRLLQVFGVMPPAAEEVGQYFFVDLGGLRLRWERHTEFVTYSFTRTLAPEQRSQQSGGWPFVAAPC